MVILTAVAMVRVGSHEALSGMYVWCVENAGRRLPWLRDLVRLVQNKTEWGTGKQFNRHFGIWTICGRFLAII